jgi:hypothetical protein
MSISEQPAVPPRSDRETGCDDPAATVWVDARTWDEADAFLAGRGWTPEERDFWASGERASLEVRKGQLSAGRAVMMHVGYSVIAGVDALGPWKFEPFYGMLWPIHLHVLMPGLEHPSQLDMVGRGILESRLVYDGYNPYYARWGVEEGIRRLGMTWWDGGGPALTHSLIERGWAAVAHDLAPVIDRQRGDLPARWLDPAWVARSKVWIPPWGDGPEKPENFWWHHVPYYLMPTEFALISALRAAPEKSLSLEDAVVAIWGASASKCSHYKGRLRTLASRANTALAGAGIVIHVKKAWDPDHLRKHVRVRVELP